VGKPYEVLNFVRGGAEPFWLLWEYR